jgi:predicted kinase
MNKNPQLLILIGAPGAGKSTFAKYFIRTEENWLRLCRDDFRMMNFSDSQLSRHEEHLIADLIDAATETLLLRKCNVLLDATHCRAEYLNHYIEKFNTLADISFKLFECDTKELLARCEKRHLKTGRYIPEDIIKRFASEFTALKTTFDFSPRSMSTACIAAKQDIELPKAIICDLDGTLALIGDRNPYDAAKCDNDDLNEAVASVLKAFHTMGYNILLLSGREELARVSTLRFLEKHAIPYHHLWMRRSKDFRKDAIVKKEIFDHEIAGKYAVEFVLDDRDQVVEMWRKQLKLNCFQVNYGNF